MKMISIPSLVPRKTIVYGFLLACLIAFICIVRIRILTTPLERDEGEYAYMGQLLLQGVPPYQDAFNMKLPGTSMMYALFMMLFGQTVSAIHLGLLFVNILSILLLYFLSKKWFDAVAGIITAASFGLLSLSPYVLGFAAHATHFVVVFALAGTLVLLHALESKKKLHFWGSGILFGLSFLMKQPGFFFFLFSVSVVAIHGFQEKIPSKTIWKMIFRLTAGFLLPFLLLVLVVVAGGSFHNFWFWVFQYAFSYGSVVPIDRGLSNLLSMLSLYWEVLPFFSILIGICAILMIAGRLLDSIKNMLLSLCVCSFLALLPSLYFRDHYFILILPACALCIGAGFYSLHHLSIGQKHIVQYGSIVLFVAVIAENVHRERLIYFSLSPTEIIRIFYIGNYFADSLPISDFLIQHTAPDERIAIVGSEPQIYFYTKRRSVSGYIYMYGMMEPQPYARCMQEEFIASIERAKPKHLVCFWMGCSWLANKQSDRHILDWVQSYTANYYQCIGAVDFLTMDSTHFVWGASARTYEPKSPEFALVFERKNNIAVP